MCTMIAMNADITGMGKGERGWFRVNQAVVGFDHTTHFENEHALLLDFVNYDLGTDARVALELDIESGKALVAKLQEAIHAAEHSGVAEVSPALSR
jgi:hypothetical protein